jgi:hypothetical protein
MRNLIIAALVFIVHSITADAQDAEAMRELKSIRSFYEGPELKHITGKMILRDDTKGTTLDKVDFEYWSKGKQLFSRMNYIEILSNKDVYVMVNKNAKTIYARPADELQNKGGAGFDVSQLQSVLNQTGTSVQIKKGSVNKITITGISGSQFSSVTISYSPADYKISSMSAEVKGADPNDRMTLLIEYRETEKTKSADESVFSAERYLTAKGGGKWVLAKKYSDFKQL